MTPAPYPTDDEIRATLLKRADEYTRITGVPRSAIGKQAVNDPALLNDIEAGRNFTVGTYQRVMGWLDLNWPERVAS